MIGKKEARIYLPLSTDGVDLRQKSEGRSMTTHKNKEGRPMRVADPVWLGPRCLLVEMRRCFCACGSVEVSYNRRKRIEKSCKYSCELMIHVVLAKCRLHHDQ